MSQERRTPGAMKGKSPSRIPLPSKRGANALGSVAASPKVVESPLTGFRRLEMMAKAEARTRNPGKAVSQGCSVPWVEKHLPASLDDLFVHKKKVEEVMNWMDRAINDTGKRVNNICVLSGPSGSGKSASVHLIGKNLGVEIKEWVNPMTLTDNQFQSGESGGYNKDDVQSRSQFDTFVDFLFRSSKYRSLVMKGKEEKKHRLVLVEDIPNVFYRDFNTFHDILRKYKSTGIVPLVFVFSDSSNSEHSMYRMFPKTLLNELNITNICFNPVAATLMSRHLLEICTRESVPIDKSTVDEIAATANGDMRCAINNLQFSLTNERTASNRQTPGFRKPAAKRPRKTEKGSKSQGSEVQQKDSTIQLFRALGKVLYAKRDEGSINQVEMELVGEMEVERRIHPLIENAENICDKVEVAADTFVGFLHQNYPAFYQSIDDMRVAVEYLSISDFVLHGWKFDDSGDGRSFKIRQVKDLVGMNIAVRGLMHSNNNRVSSSWKPLTKPLVSNMESFTKDNVESTRQALFHLRELQTTLFTEAIPFYAKLLQSKQSLQVAGRREILEKGIFSSKYNRAITLDEKETVEETPDIPVEGNGSEVKGEMKLSVQDMKEEGAIIDDLEEEFLIEEFED